MHSRIIKIIVVGTFMAKLLAGCVSKHHASKSASGSPHYDSIFHQFDTAYVTSGAIYSILDSLMANRASSKKELYLYPYFGIIQFSPHKTSDVDTISFFYSNNHDFLIRDPWWGGNITHAFQYEGEFFFLCLKKEHSLNRSDSCFFRTDDTTKKVDAFALKFITEDGAHYLNRINYLTREYSERECGLSLISSESFEY